MLVGRAFARLDQGAYMKKRTGKKTVKTASKPSASDIIKALKTGKAKAHPISKGVAKATGAVSVAEVLKTAPIAPKPESFSEMYHARGGRLWFQVVATPELRAKVEMLKAKAGARTLNDLAAKLFDEAFKAYSI